MGEKIHIICREKRFYGTISITNKIPEMRERIKGGFHVQFGEDKVQQAGVDPHSSVETDEREKKSQSSIRRCVLGVQMVCTVTPKVCARSLA